MIKNTRGLSKGLIIEINVTGSEEREICDWRGHKRLPWRAGEESVEKRN